MVEGLPLRWRWHNCWASYPIKLNTLELDWSLFVPHVTNCLPKPVTLQWHSNKVWNWISMPELHLHLKKLFSRFIISIKTHLVSCRPSSFALSTLFWHLMLMVAYDQHHVKRQTGVHSSAPLLPGCVAVASDLIPCINFFFYKMNSHWRNSKLL